MSTNTVAVYYIDHSMRHTYHTLSTTERGTHQNHHYPFIMPAEPENDLLSKICCVACLLDANSSVLPYASGVYFWPCLSDLINIVIAYMRQSCPTRSQNGVAGREVASCEKEFVHYWYLGVFQ